MGSGRRRVTRADLEAMLGEFELVERYGGTSAAVEMHLDQLRRNAMLGGSVGDWALPESWPVWAPAMRYSRSA